MKVTKMVSTTASVMIAMQLVSATSWGADSCLSWYQNVAEGSRHAEFSTKSRLGMAALSGVLFTGVAGYFLSGQYENHPRARNLAHWGAGVGAAAGGIALSRLGEHPFNSLQFGVAGALMGGVAGGSLAPLVGSSYLMNGEARLAALGVGAVAGALMYRSASKEDAALKRSNAQRDAIGRAYQVILASRSIDTGTSVTEDQKATVIKFAQQLGEGCQPEWVARLISRSNELCGKSGSTPMSDQELASLFRSKFTRGDYSCKGPIGGSSNGGAASDSSSAI